MVTQSREKEAMGSSRGAWTWLDAGITWGNGMFGPLAGEMGANTVK
jgi:hypothetical protein